MDRKRIQWNTRTKILVYMVLALIYLAGILVWGLLMDPEAYAVDYSVKFLPPGAGHLFGTDFMGRDMLLRCVKGLSTSIVIGVIASVVSSFIALAAGVAAAVVGGKLDSFVNWCVDLCMGMPL